MSSTARNTSGDYDFCIDAHGQHVCGWLGVAFLIIVIGVVFSVMALLSCHMVTVKNVAGSSFNNDQWQWIGSPDMGFYRHHAYYTTLCGSGDDINRDEECVKWIDEEVPNWGGAKGCAIVTVSLGVLLMALCLLTLVKQNRRTLLFHVLHGIMTLLALCTLTCSILVCVLVQTSVSSCGEPFCEWTIAACQENCQCENELSVKECQEHCYQTCDPTDFACEWKIVPSYGRPYGFRLAVGAAVFYALFLLCMMGLYICEKVGGRECEENHSMADEATTPGEQEKIYCDLADSAPKMLEKKMHRT